jgi:hypothetical protein
LLVLVLGGPRFGLGPVDRAAPALDVGKLMAKNDHRRSAISTPQAEHFQVFCVCICPAFLRGV